MMWVCLSFLSTPPLTPVPLSPHSHPSLPFLSCNSLLLLLPPPPPLPPPPSLCLFVSLSLFLSLSLSLSLSPLPPSLSLSVWSSFCLSVSLHLPSTPSLSPLSLILFLFHYVFLTDYRRMHRCHFPCWKAGDNANLELFKTGNLASYHLMKAVGAISDPNLQCDTDFPVHIYWSRCYLRAASRQRHCLVKRIFENNVHGLIAPKTGVIFRLIWEP